MKQVENIPTQYDFEIWNKTYDPDFVDINLKSRVPEKWMNIHYVLTDDRYSDSILKPINGYAKNFSSMPKLVSIINNTVTLRQHNYSEIFLLLKDGQLTSVDRPWVRQYYKTLANDPRPDNCFGDEYAFYMPWKIDADVEIKITSSPDGSPVHVFDKTFKNTKIDRSSRYVSSPLIPFYFKSSGPHMVTDGYGRIKLDSPIFDIIFEADNELVKEIGKLYGKED